ncbi:MAG: MFS transporter [Verrucomicrobiota bacterium]|jgi:MFS family permease
MATTPSATPASPYAILRNRNFFLYALARFIATFGQQMLFVAVGWELYERTHSSLALGLVGLTQFLPLLAMTLPAGHLADSRGRKGIIMVTLAVMAAASLGLALVSWEWAAVPWTHGEVYWVYFCLLLSGVARTFNWSATASFLPQLVSRDEFPLAVNWSSSTFQFAAVTGPVAGGAMIALTKGAASVYLFNAFAGLVCLTLISLVRAPQKLVVKEPVSLNSLLGGFRFVFNHRTILGMITLDLFAVLFGGADMLLPVYARDILHVGPQGLGLLRAALPIGSVLSAIIVAHRPPLARAGRALVVAVSIFGLATVCFGFSRLFWLSMFMLCACGMADNISIIVRHTSVQLLTPDAMRGRVSSVNNLFIDASNNLGGFESGLVSFYFGPVFSVVSGGVATILVVLTVCWFFPEIPRYGRLVQPAPAPLPGPSGKTGGSP